MRSRLSFLLASVSLAVLAVAPLAAQSTCEGQNALSAAEKAAGWRLLFDGRSLEGWHGYNGKAIPAWSVDDCALHTAGTEGNYGSDLRADLTTDAEYTNFEVSIDWKASKAGNSGLLYGVVEDPKYKAAWETGPEYQFIDDIGWPEKLAEWQKTGSDYVLHVPNDQKRLKPVGEWNTSRLVVNGTHVEHWLNGAKIVEFERWGDDWKRRRDACEAAEPRCKFRDYPGWGMAATGRLVLQDHGSRFWFRNLKLHPLP